MAIARVVIRSKENLVAIRTRDGVLAKIGRHEAYAQEPIRLPPVRVRATSGRERRYVPLGPFAMLAQ